MSGSGNKNIGLEIPGWKECEWFVYSIVPVRDIYMEF